MDPHNPDNCVKLGISLRAQGDLHGSIQNLRHALSIAPDHGEAIANLAIVCQHVCDWDALESLCRRLDDLTRRSLDAGGLPAEQPLFTIRRRADLQLNLSVARAHSCEIERRALRTAHRFNHNRRKAADNRITLGYLSYDFRNHAVTHQLLPLFRLHDRNRFRVLAFSIGPDDASDWRRSIERDCDSFVDICTTGLSQAAQTINDHRVDILIDLMGHTHHNRMAIMALRPAPLQIGYLGFLSTTGADFIDYLIADSVVCPPSHGPFFSEKRIWMPQCYQMTHDMTPRSKRKFSRQDCGLPANGFVFCCFNNVYKIDSALFQSWMDVLSQIPGSVLWLCPSNPMAVDRLQKTAESKGINPERLIFADKLPLAQHLNRLQLADLALDTLTYNGGATTANALWAGIPVLTVMGRHWVSRMSASHLKAAGLEEMVANNLIDYRQTAIALALNPEKLQAIKSRLLRNQTTHPLFNPQRFVRNLESAYTAVHQRYHNDLPPIDMHISETEIKTFETGDEI
jgi:protein O-GlcNAc transferase